MSKKNKARIPVKSKQNELPLKSKRKIDWMMIWLPARIPWWQKELEQYLKYGLLFSATENSNMNTGLL